LEAWIDQKSVRAPGRSLRFEQRIGKGRSVFDASRTMTSDRRKTFMTRSGIWIGIGAFALALMLNVNTGPSNGGTTLSNLSVGVTQAEARNKGPKRRPNRRPDLPDILDTIDDLDLGDDDDDGPDDDGPDDDDDDDAPAKKKKRR
jgi:hypothetical protein